MDWEFELLYAIQTLHAPWLDRLMVFVTNLANHGEFWIAVGLLLLCFAKTRIMGATVLISIALGYVTGNLVLKPLIARSRPCWLNPEVALLTPPLRDYSFPSGHTMVSFEGAVSIARYHRRWGWAALALAVLIGCSRLYLFVHFPTDVLAGMILGAIHALVGERLAEHVFRRRGADPAT